MRKDTVTVDLKTNAFELARLMKSHNVRNIFITKAGKYAGVVRDIDLVLTVIEPRLDPRTVAAEDIMRPPPPSVDIEAEISEIAGLMADTGVRRIAVTKKNKIIGSITAGDLLKLISYASRGELESFLNAYRVNSQNI